MVRDLLSSYVGFSLKRSAVTWSSPGEKPKLRWPYCLTRIEFSISSSNEHVVVALARRPVGVDVQWEEDLLGLPKREDQTVASSSWSRHEAVVKMQGTGLDELERYEVRGPSPVKVVDKAGLETNVVVTDLEVPMGYLGAVAGPEGYQVIERTFEYTSI